VTDPCVYQKKKRNMPEKNKIKFRNPDELIGSEYNPRKLSQEQFEAISDSLKRFGFVDPVIVNKNPERNDIIIGGHQRVKVAKQLNFKEVPTIEIDLTKEKERELNIRLNKNSGSWDMEALETYFENDELKEWGFEDWELGSDVDPDLGEFFGEGDAPESNSQGSRELVLKLSEEEHSIAVSFIEKSNKSAEKIFMDAIKK
jgi:hypothetical protein